MGVIACEFRNGALDENLMEEIDKMHFIINMDKTGLVDFVVTWSSRLIKLQTGLTLQ